MINKIWIVVFLLVALNCNASLYDYPVSPIPDTLKENADAIIRYSSVNYQINSQRRIIREDTCVITILNSKGDKHALLDIFYDDFTKLRRIRGAVYNSSGKRIKKLKKSDIEDYALIPGYNLYDDLRVKLYNPHIKKYPYTVKYTYKRIKAGSMGLDTWKPVPDYHIGIQKSILRINKPREFSIRYLEHNFQPGLPIKQRITPISLRWQLDSFQPLDPEPMGLGLPLMAPQVHLAPVNFYYDGFQGSYANWKIFGEWVYRLIKGRDELPDETIIQIRELTAGLDNKRKKVERVYRYVQENTRYVGIQYGIGGFQPIPASRVAKVGYGDCKALANYTKALLKSIDISSYYTVLGSGSRRIRFPDFASVNQTNHIILCVPLAKDTVWLECTNPYYPPGYIGKSNANRYALLITSNGGKLVKTPHYHVSDNYQTRFGSFHINENGRIQGETKTKRGGTQHEKKIKWLNESRKEQRKQLLKSLPVNQLNLEGFAQDIISHNNQEESVIELKFSADKYAKIMGKRMFFMPNILNQWSYIPKKLDERETNIRIPFGFEDKDSLVFNLPDDYVPEHIPAPDTLKTDFGFYHASYSVNEGKLYFVRTFVLNDGKYAPKRYNELLHFFEQIVEKDNTRLVLIQKE